MIFPLTPRATTTGTFNSAIRPVLAKSPPEPFVSVLGVISDFHIIANAIRMRYESTMYSSASVMEDPKRMKGANRVGLRGRCERSGVICGGGRSVGWDIVEGIDLVEYVSNGLAFIEYGGGLAEGKPDFSIQPVLKSPPPTFRSDSSLRYNGILPVPDRVLLNEGIEANDLARNLICETAIHRINKAANAIIIFRGVVSVFQSVREE